nr:unnamed protein product [Spirometra erinaceieuropaei]
MRSFCPILFLSCTLSVLAHNRETPDPATIIAVAAPAPGTLEVRWVNPSKSNVNLSSSRVFARPKDGDSEVTCHGSTEASSETTCSLTGLRNFTEYEVWVEVYTAPAKVEVEGDVTGGGCTNSLVKTKWAIPIAPNPATIIAVAAPAPGTLEVRWVNPSTANGILSSSRVFARPKDGDSEVTCHGSTEASSETRCSLTGLRNFTEYEVWVEVCTAPAKVEVEGDVTGGGCTNSLVKTKWTIPIAPDPAIITAVAAAAPGRLEVRWINPSKANGNLLSARAIARPKDGGSTVTCYGITEASFATKCSLRGLRSFTEYEVWVEVCTAPAKVEVEGDVAGGGCTNSSVKTKWTIPIAPDPASITDVVAPAPGILEVRWINPSKANGNLLTSRPIARPKDGGSEVTCNGYIGALAQTSCSLTGLRSFTEYEVWVQVCTAPTKVEVEGDAVGVFGPHQLAALGNEIAKSDKTVADPLTQISIKVALSTLPIEDVGPVSIVTAYVALASGTASQSLSRKRSLSSNSPFLYGSYDSTTWAPWEVVILNNSRGVHRRLNDIFFTIGDSSSEQTCDHCYNGALSPETKYRSNLSVITRALLHLILPLAKPEDFYVDPRKSHADIEPQYQLQTQYELASQQDGVYEMEDEVDVGVRKMNVYVDMPSLSCLKTNMPSQQPPPLPPRTPEEVHHPACMNLPGSTDALSKVTAPNVWLSANRLENAVLREGAGDVPQGQPQASAVTPAGGKPVLPPRPQSD